MINLEVINLSKNNNNYKPKDTVEEKTDNEIVSEEVVESIEETVSNEKIEEKVEEKKEEIKSSELSIEERISALEERLKKSRSEIDKAEIWGQIQELRKQTEKLADIKMVNIEDAPNITNHKNTFSARGSITNTGNTFISNI